MSDIPAKEIPLQTAIELACAAMRSNLGYIKESEFGSSIEGNFRYPNKELMRIAIGDIDPKRYEEYAVKPALLCTNLQDREMSNTIRKHFRRLLFTAIEGEDQFKTDLFNLLNKEVIPVKNLGYIAYLPLAYERDRYEIAVTTADAGYIAAVGTEVFDLDCEIISARRSKTYDAWNYDAIISNKLVSWMGKPALTVGPCVLIKGKVKDHSKHWKHPVDVTRLNYVKAFQ